MTRLTAEVSTTWREVQAVRAELDQHKKRTAKAEAKAILAEKTRDQTLLEQMNLVHLVDRRCQTLEASIGKRAIEEVIDEKLPAEEAADFSSELTSAAEEAAKFEKADDRPHPYGYEYEAIVKEVFGRLEALEGRTSSVIDAQKEHQQWEAQCNQDFRDFEKRLRETGIVPPPGCEIVVRRTS